MQEGCSPCAAAAPRDSRPPQTHPTLLHCAPLSQPLALQAWVFFRRRIAVEEATLVQFFGPQYEAYRQSVPRSGVPFIP